MLKVSVIVPCYNEQATIQLLLKSLCDQTINKSDFEVVIADGMSTDQTRAVIADFQKSNPLLNVRVVDNPNRNIPSGLNRAIASAQGEWIVRLDAHSMPQPDYVERSVAALEQGLGENVGGVWEIQPLGSGIQARAIAAVAAHPLAVGDAHYRFGTRPQITDTVPFGAYARSLVDRIGGYDESLLTNEDYEFNTRIRAVGGRIWLDPAIRTVYFARPNLAALARQYWRYGYWKARMLRRYPASLRWRQAIPPLFVATLLAGSAVAIFWPTMRLLLAGLILLYVLILSGAGLQIAWKKKDLALLAVVPLAIAIMHLTWGSAFLWSMIKQREADKVPG
jgi:succinoglycan biosynthesis protein ExoA